ncbi:MFS transporter [Yamadazyma tenuis ATCC 10573]|nr:MFS transporter [Yamadazyma tenuis ATCC 10573]EGV66342.1 MFS transporter [Yamadazyma tenuis ATCC 10573]
MSDIIPLRDRGIFQGLGNVAYSIGAASGGILGGFVNDWLGWQYVFSIQVPLSIGIGLVFLFFFVLPPGSPGLGSPGHAKEKLARIDFLGSFFLVSSLVTILLGTSLAGQYFPYISWTFGGLMLTAIVLLLVFVYVELNIAPEPILPVKLLTDRTVLSASLTNWFMTMSCFTYLFYYPVYLTSVIQLPSSKVGLRVIANFVGVSTGSLGAGIYMKRTGKYYGLNVVAVVAYWFGILSFLFLTPQSSASFQLVITFLPGWGYAIMLTVSLLALIAAVPSKFQAATTSIQYTSRFTGSTLGVCIASAIFQKILYNQLTAAIPKVVNDADKAAEIISNALADAEYSKTVSDAIRYIIVMCYERACKGAFAFSFATGCLTCVVTLFIREHKLHSNLDRN